MIGYYLRLGVRSLRRSPVLTLLTVLMLAMGIAACITTWTVYHLLSGDPLPERSGQLFYVRLNPYPPGSSPDPNHLETLLSYRDAQALLQARPQIRQTPVSLGPVIVGAMPGRPHPFQADAMLGHAAMFDMFGMSFRYGGAWSADDDIGQHRVVVLSEAFNQQLFHGSNSVGRMIPVGAHDYRVIGVLRAWAPQPRFYALRMSKSYGGGAGLIMPLDTRVADGFMPGSVDCYASGADINHLQTAPCAWQGFWAELDTRAQQMDYRQMLVGYADQQKTQGRFGSAYVGLDSLMSWLEIRKVVPQDVQLQANIAFGFLWICIVNTAGLLLAKCLRRSREIGTRRALGATRAAIFAQFLAESVAIGLAGGALGLVLSLLGLWAIRQQPAAYASLAHLDLPMFVVAWAMAMVASVLAGLLPAWRSSLLAPASQLKAV